MTTATPEAPAPTSEVGDPVPSTTEPTEPAFDISSLDEFGQQAVTRLIATINQRNELVAQIKAAGGDIESLIDEIKEGDDDEKVVKTREMITQLEDRLTQAQAALHEYASQKANERVKDRSVDLAALNTQADALDSKIKSGVKYTEMEFGPATKSALPHLTARKGRANPVKSGEGQRRIRGMDVYVDGTHATSKDAKGVERSNFSAGAKLAGVETRALQEAYWTAAGTRDVNTLADGHIARFTVTDAEGKAHEVSVTKLSAEQTPQDKSEAAA